ncbi:prepilin-type N-terminal cleavage/methylation domain-containing protein [Stenotrophomonas pictorum]|uniref:prepilin-type N-terminal cleavage/methylation domain-containing protein n=1 Tax=Stenotrophomonas pictorum TaxID=86184 RepID=UPI0009FB26B5|nr:type II secretion system protein [Stenotrophomonas pictorum]
MRLLAKIRPATRQQGFTLLEAIVTLVIVSMLVTVLMQALGQAMSLRTRLLRFEGENRVAGLQEAWFRETVAGLQRDLEEQGEGTLGTRDLMQYSTPSPLAAQGFSGVRWWLDGGRLHYADTRVTDVVVIEGPLSDAAFSYLDETGNWVDEWKWKDHKFPPKMIRFTARTGRGTLDWLVPIMADGLDPEKLKLDEVGSSGI